MPNDSPTVGSSSSRRAPPSTTTLHLLHQSPLKLEEMTSVTVGERKGEVRVHTAWSSHVVLRGLQQSDVVAQRISAQHQTNQRILNRRSSVAALPSSPARVKATAWPDVKAEKAMLPKSVTNRRASDLTKRGAELTKRTGELTKDVAVFTMQAVVRAKAAQRELARLRTARAVEHSHEQMSGVLARPAHAPSHLATRSP